MNANELLSTPQSPWQNLYVERVFRTLRRDCIDHVVVLDEKHSKRIIQEYIDKYYHISRAHLSLHKDCPKNREVEPLELGKVKSEPILGGLHHRYYRKVA